MNEDTTDAITDDGNNANAVGSDTATNGPNTNDNGNRAASRRSPYQPHAIAALIVALAGLVYAFLQVYGAVTNNGDKTQRLEHGLSVIQTAVPKLAEQLSNIPTEQPTFPPVVVKTNSGKAPNVVVTQMPGTAGAPGQPGKPGQVKIIRVTQTPNPVPTCANSLLGVCVAK